LNKQTFSWLQAAQYFCPISRFAHPRSSVSGRPASLLCALALTTSPAVSLAPGVRHAMFLTCIVVLGSAGSGWSWTSQRSPRTDPVVAAAPSGDYLFALSSGTATTTGDPAILPFLGLVQLLLQLAPAPSRPALARLDPPAVWINDQSHNVCKTRGAGTYMSSGCRSQRLDTRQPSDTPDTFLSSSLTCFFLPAWHVSFFQPDTFLSSAWHVSFFQPDTFLSSIDTLLNWYN